MNCRVFAAAASTVAVNGGDIWLRVGGGGRVGQFSHESEHDLAAMVSNFLENGSSGADSWCSSDSDYSSFSDLLHLADKISLSRHAGDQYESDLLSVVQSHLFYRCGKDLHLVKTGQCGASCIRFSLVKLLRSSGYDAAVCSARWQGYGKLPGGDHQYIDVAKHNENGSFERLIIDIDFWGHFEIARAVESYDKILKSLPVVFVGSLSKLEQYLQLMVEADRTSLKENSMPLPPWRSLAYLHAKWHSTYQRMINPEEQVDVPVSLVHNQCSGQLKRLQASLRNEIEKDGLSRPISIDKTRKLKLQIRFRAP